MDFQPGYAFAFCGTPFREIHAGAQVLSRMLAEVLWSASYLAHDRVPIRITDVDKHVCVAELGILVADIVASRLVLATHLLVQCLPCILLSHLHASKGKEAALLCCLMPIKSPLFHPSCKAR